jgi:hypothetical protein
LVHGHDAHSVGVGVLIILSAFRIATPRRFFQTLARGLA